MQSPNEEDVGLSPLQKREKEIAEANFNAKIQSYLATAARPETPAPERLFRVLFVGGDEVARGLGRFCEVARPGPDELDALAGGERFDLALVELTFDYGAQTAWRPLLTGSASPARALDKLRSVATSLAAWHTLPATSLDAFQAVLSLVENAFFADPAAIARAPEGRGRHLPVCYDPVRSNPWRGDMPTNIAASLPIVFDSPFRDLMFSRDGEALSEALSPFLRYRSWGFEHDLRLRPKDELTPLHMQRRYVGQLDDAGRSTALALARFAVELASAAGADPILKTRHCLEAIGSKAIPLANFTPVLGPGGADGLFLPIGDALFEALDDYPARYWAFEEFAHLGYRAALTRHSYRARFRELLEALPDVAGRPEFVARLSALTRQPSVSLIVPTMRPWMVPYVYGMFRDQTVEDKELILCLHGDDFDFRQAFPEIAADERVSWRHVPSRYNIGSVLNVGIEASRGAFWAKVDDDDYYGPHYISDYLLMLNYCAFDIAGKAHFFTYDEAARTMMARRNPVSVHGPRDTFAGGSILCRKANGDLRFSEGVKGYADMDFLWGGLEKGARLVAGDQYNFVQIRRADKAGHTWRVNSGSFQVTTPFCDGFDLARVAI